MSTKRERIPQSMIESILDRNPIDTVVARYISLRNLDDTLCGVCPFHSSRDTASTLIVDRETQRFECSVCGFKGSAIGWLQYYDGCSFDEAISQLAENADFDVTSYLPSGAGARSKDERAESLDSVVSYFQEQLESNVDAAAFVRERCLDPSVLKMFRVGFAPLDRSAISEHFKDDLRDLYRHGVLIRQADGHFMSRFVNRVMFPIRDVDGATIGFGGRSINDYLPKYLNSPGSHAFNKSDIVFGLFEALNQPNVPKRLILVEGYIDVLMLHQRGFSNAVATLGTACSAKHLAKLFAAVPEIIVCYDGDKAGHQASQNLLTTALPLLDEGLSLKFVQLPDDFDPDSYVRHSGENAFQDLVANASELDSYIMSTLTVGLDRRSIGQLAALASKVKSIIVTTTSIELKLALIGAVENILGIVWSDDDIEFIKNERQK